MTESIPPWPPILRASSPVAFQRGCSYLSRNESIFCQSSCFVPSTKTRGGVIGERALCTRDRVEAAVRSWVDHVMLEKNRAASLGFYDAGVHVTADVPFGALRVPVSEVRFHIRAQRSLGRTHRNHVVEPVAAMDVHVMGHRAQSVRRIQIAIALDMGKTAPQAFPFT